MKERVRTQILEAAAHAIAVDGYHGMSMRDLARSTGMGLSSFYNYFSSKEDVLFAIQSRAFDTLVRSARDQLEGTVGAANQLYAFVVNHVRYFVDHPDVMRVLIHEAAALPPQRRQAIREKKEAYFAIGRDIVSRILTTGCERPGVEPSTVDAAELDRVTYSLFGMLNWVYGWYDPDQHGDPQEVGRTIHRLALCGMVARCPHRMQPDSELQVRLQAARPRAPLCVDEPANSDPDARDPEVADA